MDQLTDQLAVWSNYYLSAEINKYVSASVSVLTNRELKLGISRSDYSPSNTDPHVEPSRTLSVKYGHNYHGVLTKNVVTVNFDPPTTPNSNQFVLESTWMIVSERRRSGETVISCRWSKEETHVIFILNGLLIKCESAHSSNTPSSAATPVCPQKDGAMKSRFQSVYFGKHHSK